MDANNTKFHLLLGKDDWFPKEASASPPLSPEAYSSCDEAAWAVPKLSPYMTGPALHWDDQRNVVTLQPCNFKFTAAPADIKPSIEDRRGAGCDGFGNWYWIADSTQEILVNSAGSMVTSHFWGPGDHEDCGIQDNGAFQSVTLQDQPSVTKLCGLAITEDHYLVAGTLDPGGLLIFDLYGGGPPRWAEWRDAFTPFDLAPAPGGGVLILDQNAKMVWALNRDFSLHGGSAQSEEERMEYFQSLSSGGVDPSAACDGRRIVGGGLPIQGIALAEDADPIAVECLADGSVLVLEVVTKDKCRVRRYSLDGIPSGEVLLDGASGNYHYPVVGHDIVFVGTAGSKGERWKGRLYVADREGNQAVAFAVSYDDTHFELDLAMEFFPMRLFGGKGLVACNGGPYYDFGDRWIPLVRQNRPRYLELGFLCTDADSPLDGREPDCVWHRLLLDGTIPPETQVTVWSRAAREKNEVEAADWQEEPPLYRRGDGCELPYLRQGSYDTYELLFQAARGRYLQLKLAFSGNGRATPCIRALRVYYPRFSYLEHYLPAVYRENKVSASFLDRFLANIEGMYTAIEDRIAAAQILFDPEVAPSEVLDWLAEWLGVALDRAWDERRRRLFLRHAMEFFRCRGTIRGLQIALRLAMDEQVDERIFTDRSTGYSSLSPIRIVEKFRARRSPGVVLGDPALSEGPALVTASERWSPKQKRDELNRRYGEFLAQRVETATGHEEYPLQAPEESEQAAAWKEFSLQVLGFLPSDGPKDLKRWQEFLARRYRTIAAAKDAHKTHWTSFDDASLPASLPADGSPLFDWFQFESVVLPMHEAAHRFTVVLPVPLSATADTEEYRRRLELAERLVKLEKPAHTDFSVHFYWAMFRVGEVRVGYDTLVDQGSRAPGFMAAMVLGREHVGEGYIRSCHPGLAGRYALGQSEVGKAYC